MAPPRRHGYNPPMDAAAVIAPVSAFPQILAAGAQETLFQILYLLVPFLVVGLGLHGLERIVQRSLARHFGWGSVLWTGWLGTPIHELSHAAFCLLFAHRIEEMAVFRPDRESGRMGYVRHSWNPANPWAVVGNFFIGVAPLIGGVLALYFLLWLFFPEAAARAVEGSDVMGAVSRGEFVGAVDGFLSLVSSVLATVFDAPNLLRWQFWVFLYLILCVGSHLAPSPTDYRGAGRGAAVLLLLLFLCNWAFLLLGGEPGWLMREGTRLLGPAMALFLLAVVLTGGTAVLVLTFTWVLDWVRVRQPGHAG